MAALVFTHAKIYYKQYRDNAYNPGDLFL